MEDGVEEIRNLISTESRSLEGAEETEQLKDRDEAKPKGAINNFINNLVSVNGEGEIEQPDEKRGKPEGKERGRMNHLISNLVSPKPNPNSSSGGGERKAEERKGDDIEEVRREDKIFKSQEEHRTGGGGGIMNTLITNIIHRDQDGGGGGGEVRSSDIEEEVKNAEGHQEKKREGSGTIGGAVVDSLVSNLSITLAAEDAAPAVDEASILIHSIVHD